MAITSTASVLKRNQVIVDPRPFTTAVSKFWHSPQPAFLSIFIFAALHFLAPGFSLLFFIIFSLILIANLKTPLKLPNKMPQSSGAKLDPNSIKAGKETTKNKPQGISCLGVDRETGYQVWEDKDTYLRHFNLLATTGSGKTYSLRFHIMMALIQTSGLIAIDGKGDIALPLDLISLLRRMGREDDLRILNFKQGNANVYNESGVPRTNTFNPLSTGSTTYIAEVLKSLLDSSNEGAKGGDVFKQRAESMCGTLAGLATYRRDHFSFKIRPGSIAEMLELRELCRIYEDDDIPEKFKLDLNIYFKTLPDFELSQAKAYANGKEFKGKILEQHGYVSMQLQPALQILSTQYGFIFDTDNPEIDMKDVATNNRILLVLLPAMEQSEPTLRNTGKIILAALKGMISGELGDKFQGNIPELLDKRSCKDPAPTPVFLDECGYYAIINGIEILPAQGRGLGFSFWFMGQTYADYEKSGKGTGDIIWDNGVNKTIGTAAGDTTYNKVNEYLGDVDVLVRDRMDIDVGEFTTTKKNTDSLSIARRRRLEIGDLQSLREGQFFHIVKEKLISIQTGDPIIKGDIKETRYNQLVGLHDIPKSIKSELTISLKKASDRCKENLKGKKPRNLSFNKLRSLESILNEYQKANSLGISKTINNRINLWQIILFKQASVEFEIQEDEFKDTTSKILEGVLGKNTQPDLFTEESKSQSSETANKNKSWAQLALDATADIDDEEADDDDSDYVELDEEPDQGISPQVEDSGSQETEKQTELDYLSHLLDSGKITESEYKAEIALLNEPTSDIIEENPTDDDEQDPFGAFTLDQIPLPDDADVPSSGEQLSITEDGFEECAQESYPSKKSKDMESKADKEIAAKILVDVDQAFNLNI